MKAFSYNFLLLKKTEWKAFMLLNHEEYQFEDLG